MSLFKMFVFVPVAALIACGGKGGGGAAGGGGSDDGPFAGFDLDAKKFEGTWVFRGNMLETTVWDIKDGKVTEVTKSGEKTGAFSVDTPCSVGIETEKDGMKMKLAYKFTRTGDKLHMGLGLAGVKAGDKIAVCGADIGSSVYVLEGATCTKWEDKFNQGWKSEPAECKLEGDKLTIKTKFMDKVEDKVVMVEGATLWDDQMKTDNLAEKVADLAAGKAKLQ